MSGANASPAWRSHQAMSGANASPAWRSHQSMSGANASPAWRSDHPCRYWPVHPWTANDSDSCIAFVSYLQYIVFMQSETLSLRISRSERRALKVRARKEGISQGSLVRRALRAYGVTPEPESAKSGYDVVKHLIGKNRGKSTDLSTNLRHLDDYGR